MDSSTSRALRMFEAVTPIAGARRAEMWVGGVSCVNAPAKNIFGAEKNISGDKKGQYYVNHQNPMVKRFFENRYQNLPRKHFENHVLCKPST